ncbi:MAG: TetR/AcrR family transcriptional regulator [Bacteroidales bacterium]|jgi:AcrR family transcriptional regulator|nr:TetR/AcrR family transcriptional regulator [Bacteroidales bacterium]MDD2771917.1 TetR/AcrR family transcriptional regulator [Bacteroidales bacterium]MDD3105290.1 TetR/AcrR family transcriptional regulator [Bacteroidales bacterium]MDD3549427.1 TetR/AcrR family transcriptional regulator [Bacteroidales bacterium]MDD4064236.1 TetR/AcrR family transcriptional regulator [Bacteroidales bacterium]
MKQPVKKNTETKLTEAGRALFWKFGFTKVTVEEICHNAGVSKMTFYRYFENKTELAKRILDNAAAEGMERFRSLMNAKIPAEEKMRRMILMKMEGTADISREFIEDIYSREGSHLQEYMMELTGKTGGLIMETFREAQDKGFFRKDFKPEMLLAMSMKMIDLLTDKRLSALYPNVNEMIGDITRIITCGIGAGEKT